MTASTHKKADVIVIGTGMGGATIGYALAKASLKVLFLEKGLSRGKTGKKYEGDFAEVYGFRKNAQERRLLLKKSGRYFSTITDISQSRTKKLTPFMGAGTGGGTAVYGAILERFKVEDFAPGQFYSKVGNEFSVPEKWPVSYAEMQPWYQQAEQLYGVKYTAQDSQKMPAHISMANQAAWQQLKQNGCHPYLLPTATDNMAGCKDNCQSFLCARHCKNDSEKCALQPAIEDYQAELIDDCEVLELISRQGKITQVRCRQGEQIIHLSADRFILAAGALATPALLLKSSNLANSSGLVGKYLMRHYVDLLAVKIKSDKKAVPVQFQSQKQIGFNDLYLLEQGKFGTVQSFGSMPPVEVVIEELSESMPVGLNQAVRWGMKAIFPLMKVFYQRYFSDKLIFASIVEDLPSINNYVTFNNGQIELNYNVGAEEKQRIKILRQEVVKAFRPLPVSIMKQAENNHRLAHACGTCRFGNDPELSVLDRFNRAHDVQNLYIVDASFFPTSGGINPSLTIAANALRVADSILQE